MEAALLVIELDPSSEAGYCEGRLLDKRPHGYEAVKSAISLALKDGAIASHIVEEPLRDSVDYRYPTNLIDVTFSRVKVGSLCKWLASRGFPEAFGRYKRVASHDIRP